MIAVMRIAEVMTEQVVTAAPEASFASVAGLMRDRNVGSVVIVEGDRPVAVVTDRDVALAVAGDGAGRDQPVSSLPSRPIVAAHVAMDLEEGAALMVQNGVRRLPVMDGERLAGIVTIDDIAVRSGDAEMARRLTAEVAKAALPEFFFHQRGG
jgi:CBS domain-containing protein